VAYAGAEIEVAPGRFLLEPRVLAKMLDAAAIGPRDLVLELAPATGYSTALIARMAEAVIAVEPDRALAAQAQEAMARLEIDNAVVSTGDPAGGDPGHAPFDVIAVNGAVERLPEILTDQLRDGGRLVAIFLEDGRSQCRVVTRSGNGLSERYLFDGAAPLVAGFERPEAFSF
jgi:protein-L-isoaspartate(D-aspartate) O-methyltransferase